MTDRRILNEHQDPFVDPPGAPMPNDDVTMRTWPDYIVQCRAEYPTRPNPLPHTRIVRCNRLDGHGGEHAELIDGEVGNTWPAEPAVEPLDGPDSTAATNDSQKPASVDYSGRSGATGRNGSTGTTGRQDGDALAALLAEDGRDARYIDAARARAHVIAAQMDPPHIGPLTPGMESAVLYTATGEAWRAAIDHTWNAARSTRDDEMTALRAELADERLGRTNALGYLAEAERERDAAQRKLTATTQVAEDLVGKFRAAIAERDEARRQLAATQGELNAARNLLAWHADDDPCRLDHNGFCQAHASAPCLNEATKAYLAEGRSAILRLLDGDEA